MLEKFFKLKENNTNIKTEIIAGITTFMTMAYILAVNPNILSAAGMNANGVFIATALASCVGTLFMALFANYPFALAPGMGLNAYFTYSIAIGMGYGWQTALTAVFVEGIIFILLSATNIRTAIFDAIPFSLKTAVSVGMGFYIALIGLQNSNILVGGFNLFSISGYIEANPTALNASMSNVGITVILAIVGTIITACMLVKNVKGSILWGIIITWIIGIICELTGLYVPDVQLGFYSVIPESIISLHFEDLKEVAFKIDFSQVLESREALLNFVVVIFAFLFVDLFETIGTLIGVSLKTDMITKDGKLPRVKGALLADAFATVFGAVMGTSTTTTYIESASGISQGGRTGLTALVVAVLFGLSLFFSPLFLAIPSFATTPALIIVGYLMITNITNINFENNFEALPAFFCICAMPFFNSVADGIAIGIISHTVFHFVNPDKNKKISPVMYILTILFLLKYIFL